MDHQITTEKRASGLHHGEIEIKIVKKKKKEGGEGSTSIHVFCPEQPQETHHGC